MNLVPEMDGMRDDGAECDEIDERRNAVSNGKSRIEGLHLITQNVICILCIGGSLQFVSFVHDALSYR